jgi:ATP-binding cassette, subfamily B, bacterial HlyB/CyaB
MVIAIALRLAGLVQPFVFQTIIDRVLPFRREATLVLIVGLLVGTALFVASLGTIAGKIYTPRSINTPQEPSAMSSC